MARCYHCEKYIGETTGKQDQCQRCGQCLACYGCIPKERCNQFPIPHLYATSPRIKNTLERALGVEFEISDIVDVSGFKTLINQALIEKKTGINLVSYHRDGSVRPSEFEMVTVPLVGDPFVNMIEKVQTIFDSLKGNLACNKTCGYHVHVDASRETNITFKNFLYLYLKLEEEIYKRTCAKNRLTNDCCLPLRKYTDKYFTPDDLFDPNLSSAAFIRMLYSIYGIDTNTDNYELLLSNAEFKRLKNNRRAFGYERENNPRYAGLNIHAYFHMGTIEWRMKEGTLKANEVLGWPLFCGWFTHLGLSLPVKTLKSINTLDDFLALPQIPKPMLATFKSLLTTVKDPKAEPEQPLLDVQPRVEQQAPPRRGAVAPGGLPLTDAFGGPQWTIGRTTTGHMRVTAPRNPAGETWREFADRVRRENRMELELEEARQRFINTEREQN